MARLDRRRLPSAGIELPKYEPAKIYGTFVIPLAYYEIVLSTSYARIYRNARRQVRTVPILDPGLDEGPGLVARWLVYLGFTLFPVAAQVHFVWQILNGEVFPFHARPATVSGLREMLTVPLKLCKNCWRFGDPDGPEFFPLVQPWLLVLLLLGLLAMLALLARALLQDHPKKPKTSHGGTHAT